MANIASARKRAKQAVVRRARNMAQRTMLRTSIKKVRLALSKKDKDGAASAFKEAQPIIDKMARKGIIHKNTAARYKQRLNRAVKALVLAA